MVKMAPKRVFVMQDFEPYYRAARSRLLEYGVDLPDEVDWREVEMKRGEMISPLDFIPFVVKLEEESKKAGGLRIIPCEILKTLRACVDYARRASHGLAVLMWYDNQDDSPHAHSTKAFQVRFQEACARLKALTKVPQRYLLQVASIFEEKGGDEPDLYWLSPSPLHAGGWRSSNDRRTTWCVAQDEVILWNYLKGHGFSPVEWTPDRPMKFGVPDGTQYFTRPGVNWTTAPKTGRMPGLVAAYLADEPDPLRETGQSKIYLD